MMRLIYGGMERHSTFNRKSKGENMEATAWKEDCYADKHWSRLQISDVPTRTIKNLQKIVYFKSLITVLNNFGYSLIANSFPIIMCN